MHVHLVDEEKALWLALRADANKVLQSVLHISCDQATLFEHQVFGSVVGSEDVTIYHMNMYREVMCHMCQACDQMRTSLVQDFQTTLPAFTRSFTAHISDTLVVAEEETTYTTPSKQLFHEVVRPQLMALQADTEEDLPECPTCHTNKYMSVIQVQTRSADEAATNFPKCTNCQKILTDHAF
jgi:DNA-directed RNA polymerase subunit M/transcription elongation factor TFIIS